MAHDEQLAGDAAARGLSRRKLIFSGATLAAAGVATGALISTSIQSESHAAAAGDLDAPTPDEPVVVHLRDLQSGQLELFVGTKHVSFTDRGVAAVLARTATTAS